MYWEFPRHRYTFFSRLKIRSLSFFFCLSELLPLVWKSRHVKFLILVLFLVVLYLFQICIPLYKALRKYTIFISSLTKRFISSKCALSQYFFFGGEVSIDPTASYEMYYCMLGSVRSSHLPFKMH